MGPGFFITFEGGEGAGKSTQIDRLSSKLRGKGYDVVVTREPGGSPGAEMVRHILLSGAAEPFGPGMETLLFAAARADHIDQTISPAVARGAIVLCDRFLDSTRVYQGLEGGSVSRLVEMLEPIIVGPAMPDMTLVLDISAEEGLRRAAARRGLEGVDRFEKEGLDIHEKRRQAFLAIAENEPERCIVIDASFETDDVDNLVTAAVFAALEVRGQVADYTDPSS